MAFRSEGPAAGFFRLRDFAPAGCFFFFASAFGRRFTPFSGHFSFVYCATPQRFSPREPSRFAPTPACLRLPSFRRHFAASRFDLFLSFSFAV